MSFEQNYSAYLHLDLSRYVGEWIAILKNDVIAHGANPRDVYKKATIASNNQLFMFIKVPKANVPELL